MSAVIIGRPLAERRWAVTLGTAMVGVALVIIWQIGSSSSLDFIIASPSRTLQMLWDGLFGSRPVMVQHARATFTAAGLGYLLAIVVGVVAGIYLGANQYQRQIFEPLILTAYSIPKIILFPIFLSILGIGLPASATMAFIHAVFPLMINVMGGVKEINPVYIKVGRAFRCSRGDQIVKIYFPAVALSLVVGLRMGFSFSIIGAVLSELFASREGLGRLIMSRYSVFDMPGMFAPLLLLFVVAFVGNALFWALEKRLRGAK